MKEVIILKEVDPVDVFNIQQAALIENKNVEDFILEAAMKAADKVVEDKVRGT